MPQFQFVDGAGLGKDKVFGQTNREIIGHFQVARLGHGQVAGLIVQTIDVLKIQGTAASGGQRAIAGEQPCNSQGAALGGDGAVVVM